ncbi:MAG: Ig-like domain-containing protein, partial [Roseiflexaceae bacterium]
MRILRWVSRLWIGVLLLTVLLVGLLFVLRLLLPLPFLSPAPELMQSNPTDGAASVLPRAPVILRFNTPMNPHSVAHALQIDPPMDAKLFWDEGNTTLTISPTRSLQPATTYRVALGAGALSRMFRSQEHPLVLSFRIAPAPAVLAVLPADGTQDVALDAPISIRFSRAIVLTDTLGLPAALPELLFAPPLEGSATWLDSATVLFRPAAPLRPGVRYRATLAAGLTDLGGGELGRDFSWSFSTPPPKV